MSGQVILNLDEQLIECIDEEKGRIGATRDGMVVRILEKHFAEKKEQQKVYCEWFMAEVEKSVRSAREGPSVAHEDAMKRIRTIIAEAQEKNAGHLV